MSEKMSGKMPEKIKKQISFDLKQIEDNGEFVIVKGLASTFGNTDRHGDIIHPLAFDKSIAALKKRALKINSVIEGTDERALLPSLFQHDTDKPIGSFVELSVTDQGLMTTQILPKADTLVSGTILPQLKVKSIGSMSIGGFVMNSEFDRETDIRTITEFDLFEISLVVMPANPMAVVTSVKSMDRDHLLPLAKFNHEWNQEEAAKRVGALDPDFHKTSFAFGGDFSNGIIKSFLFSDVVDGELKAIPRAVFSSAVKIEIINLDQLSAANISIIKENISLIYQKMGRENPFQIGFSDAELKTASLSEMTSLFRQGIKLSRSGAEYAVNAIIESNNKDSLDLGTKYNGSDTRTNDKLLEIINKIKVS